MSEALIIDAVRTPRAIGKPGKGAYAGMHPQHLASTVLKAIQQRNNLNTPDIDDVIWGTSAQKGCKAEIWAAWPHWTRASTFASAASRSIASAAAASRQPIWLRGNQVRTWKI